jgi:hypothetical protein
MSGELKAEEEQSFELEDAEQPLPPTDIVAYNELRSCADLVRMHSSGKMEIQPDFQRDVVWKLDDQSRFIDSLVKQLPIPSMCFSLDYKTQRWKVIDGLQRMSSIIRFLSDTEWRLSDLQDIHPSLRRATNLALKGGTEEQKRIYSLVEDVSIPITVIRCDYTKKSHMRYLFTIFHRLNSGGVRLTNQEIRNCIYNGAFNDVLKTFDRSNAEWKAVQRRTWGRMDRFRSVEVLLRMLAFAERLEHYDGNLARFLNDYMQEQSEKAADSFHHLPSDLAKVSEHALVTFGPGRHKLPLTLVEAVLVALYVNRAGLASRPSEHLRLAFKELQETPSFADSARYAVSSADNVKTRLRVALKAFA